jgi:DNA-binding beta-propeller fold protein YncE
MYRVLLTTAAVLALGLAAVATTAATGSPSGISLQPYGTYASGVPTNGDVGAAEIPAYDPVSRRVFVTNAIEQRLDVLSAADPSKPTLLGSIPLEGTPNSVAVSRGLLAVALEAEPKTDPGTVVFYFASCLVKLERGCRPLKTLQVGALPDMLTFTPDGQRLLVANEGEPDGDVDPPGSVSIIDLRFTVFFAHVRTVDFSSLDGQELPPGVILQEGKLPSEDFEPEYIAVDPDSRTAWVALQEANAFATIDIRNAELTGLSGLGFKDHGLPENTLDASDRDNRINICAWANVYGVYQPDGIAAFRANGETYIVSANEGDSRGDDESRVGDLPSTAFDETFPSSIRTSRNLGRLTVNKNLGLNDEGVYEGLYAYGARSFSIWSGSGDLVYDSGNELERIAASFPAQAAVADPYAQPLVLAGPAVPPAPAATCPLPSGTLPSAPPATTPFNANHELGPSFDNRSDNKGPEPEGIAVGDVRGRTYAFVGLERLSGVVVYDVSDPAAPAFVQFVNPRNFAAVYDLDPESEDFPGDWQSAGDLGPEGLAFVPAAESPIRVPLLIVANEVSGTTTIYRIDPRS